MSAPPYNSRETQPAVITHDVRLLGTGAAVPTAVLASGITVTRDGVGIYTLTWSANPGVWMGSTGSGFQATTSADVKGCSVSWGVFNTTTYAVQFKVWDVTGAARELGVLEWLSFGLKFKNTGV